MSPYSILKNWLLNNRNNMNVPEECKFLSILSILAMFSNHGEITIYLNDTFNNFNITKYNSEDFLKMLKNIIHNNRNKFDFNSFSFLNIKKKKEDECVYYKNLIRYFPFLKEYEVDNLYEYIKEDENYTSFLERIEETNIKIKKKRGKKKDV